MAKANTEKAKSGVKKIGYRLKKNPLKTKDKVPK